MTVSPQQAMHPVTLKNLLLAHSVRSLFTPRWLCFFVPMRLYKWLTARLLSPLAIYFLLHTLSTYCVFIYIYLYL